MNEIKLLKNNDKKDWDDIEWVNEFYDFMRGEIPESIRLENPLNLSDKDAFTIILYLQEHFSLIPSNIERCDVCSNLYDSNAGGVYTDHSNVKGHHSFCDSECESQYRFPVRDLQELLKQSLEAMSRHSDYDLYDLVVCMYESDDTINRSEKYILEEYFEGKEWENLNREQVLGLLDKKLKE